MISIIVCSLRPSLADALLENIDQSVGVTHEVICVDNSGGRYSIFEAYNFGASQAAYDVLCFMHEDILFRTPDWGKLVADKLADPKNGVLGVAGAIYKPASPSPWWISDTEDQTAYQRINILQHFSGGVKKQHVRGKVSNAGKGDDGWDEVVVLDGVWLCCRKEIWMETPFDAENYKGFHFYDLDFSLAVRSRGYRNFVAQDILLEHFSAGFMDGNWIRGAEIFHKKWRKTLPRSLGDVRARERKGLEMSAARNFLRILTYNRHKDAGLWLKYWIRTAVYRPFAKDSFLSLISYARAFFK